jgi:hypothetical protein
MNFSEAVVQHNNTTTTTNGAKAYVSTCNKVLDFFSKAGSMRNIDSTSSFKEAFDENKDLALRSLLWVRDVRGGAGERKVFRDNLEYLLTNNLVPASFLSKIPEVGRWDDLFVAFNTPYDGHALHLIKLALKAKDALCAKWMPRKGAIAETIRKYLRLTPKSYRKLLVGLTQVVETKMCSQDWDSIEYSKVPSSAHNIYKKAFSLHSPERYSEYKESLTKGEAKINASVLYPHQVVKSLSIDKTIANAQWKALPNYIPSDSSILPMIDLSGSMDTQSAASGFSCKELAIALGLYTSTKNTGVFQNLWLNFSRKPRMYELTGDTLAQQYNSLNFSDWGGSTDINLAFDLILDVAVQNELSNDDLPKVLLVLSDMQFDAANGDGFTNFEEVKIRFKEFGYELPNVVFWNLNASYSNQPCKKDDSGAMLVSGFSPSILEPVLSNKIENITPEGLMINVLMKDRYAF